MAYSQGEASPSELAVKLGRPLNAVAYHTQRLVEMACVELVRTERGPGIKHFYRAIVRADLEDAAWRRLPRGLRRSLAAPTLGQLVEEAGRASSHGALDADDVHFSRVPLELDEAAWAELSALLREVVARAQQLSRESAGRRRSSTVERPSVLGIFHFPRG